MVKAIQEGKTLVQKTNDLVAWWLQDKAVEIRYQYNQKGTGKLSPDFDAIFYLDGRKITDRCLGMLIICDLRDRNYNYMMSQIVAAITSLAWTHFVQNIDYPDWMRPEGMEVPTRKPRGRPRKGPAKISVPPADQTVRLGDLEPIAEPEPFEPKPEYATVNNSTASDKPQPPRGLV